MSCKVVLIGATPSGSKVLQQLIGNKSIELQLVVTYPIEHSIVRNTNIIPTPLNVPIYRETDVNRLTKTIEAVKPDFILVVGWSYMLGPGLLSAATKGVIGFHPSRLPADRGRSVLAWQISEGYKESAVTMLHLDERPDAGDIIAQEPLPIAEDDYIEDVLNKVEFTIAAMIKKYLPLLADDRAPRLPQNHSRSNYRRLRTSADSLINWNAGVHAIYNHIRAISRPYPGADLLLNREPRKVWRSRIKNVSQKKSIQGLRDEFLATIIEVKKTAGTVFNVKMV